MAQIFTGGRSVFFFADFFTHKSGMPTSTFQEQGTVTPVPVASLPEEHRCQSHPGCVCVGRLAEHVGETSSSPPSRASSARAPLDRFRRWCETLKDMAPVFSCFVRSKRVKTCYLQAQPAALRAMWHPRPRAEEVLDLQKGFLTAGKLTDIENDIVVDEK